MDWLRRNPSAVPWILLGADIGLRIATRVYRTYDGCDDDDQDDTVNESPIRSILPQLTQQELADLPYPPDAYPGARDVTSPYGSLRVYEWGPTDGRKVLLVHGITNPCVVLGAVAQELVDRGCRVIVFDLPGRGYSSAPRQTPQSVRFFTTCILLAIASSPLPWTGGNDNRFALIGYSLGGGIVAAFTAYFPSLVSSLILLAPSGLVRTSHISFTNRLLYGYGLLPEPLLERFVTRRLKSGDPPVAPPKPSTSTSSSTETAASPEAPQDNASPTSPLSERYPEISIPHVLMWQIQANRDFVHSYISGLRYGPIHNQHATWARIGQRLNAQKLNASTAREADSKKEAEGELHGGTVLIVCGRTDGLVAAQELNEDAAECLGAGNFVLRQVDAGHDLPVTKSREVVDLICEHWGR